MRRAAIVVLAALWLAISGGLAEAQQPASSAELLADVEWVIAAFAKESNGAVVLETTDLIAEVQNRLPGVTLRNAALSFRNWGRIELGTVRAVEQRPAPRGHKRIAFLFPNTVELYNVDGQHVPPPVTLSDASLTFDFTPERDRLRRAALVARDVEIVEATATMTAQGLSIVSQRTPDIDNRWIGVSSLDIDKLWIRGIEADHLKVEKFAFEQTAAGVNIDALDGFFASLGNLQVAATDVTASWNAMLRSVVAGLQKHGVLMSAVKQSIRVGGFDFVDPAKDLNVRLAGLVLEQDMHGFDKGSVDWRIVTEYAGLETPQKTVDPRLFLSGLAVDLTFRGIPAGRMLDEAAASFERMAPGESDPTLFAAMQDIVTAAGTSLQINRLAFTMPRLAGQASALFTLDGNAANLGSGEALVIFHGLDLLVQDIRSGRDSYDPQTTNIIMMLAAFAIPTQMPDGRPVQALRVQFGRDGKLMVNGRDLAVPSPQQRVP